MTLCVSDDFKNLDVGKFVFAHPVYLQGIRVILVCKGHLVTVKVVGTKRSKIPTRAL